MAEVEGPYYDDLRQRMQSDRFSFEGGRCSYCIASQPSRDSFSIGDARGRWSIGCHQRVALLDE